MSTQRRNAFADTEAPQQFDVKPRPSGPTEVEHVDRLALDNNFPSRQAPRALPEAAAAPATRNRRVHRTGRNQQLNFKATAETIERFYSMADKKRVPLCELLELALDALERSNKD